MAHQANEKEAGIIDKTSPALALLSPNSSRLIIFGIAVALFFLLCVLPFLYMFTLSLTNENGALSLENYKQLLLASKQRELLANSTILGVGAAMIATLLGVPLGLLFARVDIAAKRFLRLALIIPLVVPPHILALAWIYIGGSAGFMAQVTGYDVLSEWTYSRTGAVIILGISLYPLSMLITEAAARRVESSLEEAALLVAHPRRILWRITLPLIAPAIVASTLIIFVLALSEFGVPGLLRVRVFTTEIFTAFAALYNFGAATALSIPLLVVTMMAGITARFLIGNSLMASRRSSRTGLSLSLGRWHFFTLVCMAMVFAVSVIFPLLALCFEVGRLERIGVAIKESSNAIFNSFILSLIGATLIVALAALLGYMRSRLRNRWGDFSDAVLITIFAVPSTVVGIGIIGLWNRSGWLGEIYTSSMIIVVAYLARFVPITALVLSASARQVPTSIEEAAEITGAGWTRTFIRIVVPQMRSGLVASWIVAFIFTFGELGATTLVTPPGESTLPVRIYTLIANAPSSQVAALALMEVFIILLPLSLLSFFARTNRNN